MAGSRKKGEGPCHYLKGGVAKLDTVDIGWQNVPDIYLIAVYISWNFPIKVLLIFQQQLDKFKWQSRLFPWLCISLVNCVISPNNHCTIIGPGPAGHGDTYKLNTRALHICSDMGRDRLCVMEKCWWGRKKEGWMNEGGREREKTPHLIVAPASQRPWTLSVLRKKHDRENRPKCLCVWYFLDLFWT